MNMNNTPTAGRFLPHSTLTEIWRDNVELVIWITVFSHVILKISFGWRCICTWGTFLKSFKQKNREVTRSHFVGFWTGAFVFYTAVSISVYGNFYGKWNRTILHDNGSSNPMPPKYLLPSLSLSLFVAIIVEVVFRTCDYLLLEPIYQKVPSSIEDEEKNDEDEGNEIQEEEVPHTKKSISWPCFWYLWLFAIDSLNHSAGRPESEIHIEYLGPLRFTKMPNLHYSKEAIVYDKHYWYPCLEGTPTTGNYNSQILQPSIQVRVEVGWGYSWGCRSKANSNKWMTSTLSIDECTSFICRHDGKSTCSCYTDKESAWNASLQCVNDAFNLTLLEQNVTFDKEQPPWEDKSGWPTLTKYGSCDDESGNPHSIDDVQYFAPREKRALLYRYFGLFSLILSLVVANLKPNSRDWRLDLRFTSRHDMRYCVATY